MSDTPYRLATEIYKQGIECDAAAGLIRRKLPALLAEVVAEVKRTMGNEYDAEKERVEFGAAPGRGAGGGR